MKLTQSVLFGETYGPVMVGLNERERQTLKRAAEILWEIDDLGRRHAYVTYDDETCWVDGADARTDLVIAADTVESLARGGELAVDQ